jgi:DNA-binding NtrC family response regulator
MPSRLLVVDDERLIRWSLENTLQDAGYDVTVAEDGASAMRAMRDEPLDLVLLDLKLPDTDGLHVLKQVKETQPDVQVVIMTAYADVATAVEAMRLGAYDYVAKPIDFEILGVTLRNALETRQLRQKVEFLREKHLHPYHFDRMIGTSRAVQEVLGLARKVSASGATTVLIQGESGTGKDLLAKAVHYESARADEPFMDITCTAMPETLLESELFGHERGAFTDARTQKKGLFELAHGGTIFLDEIGDMTPALQAKLLRVLEDGEFERLGSTRSIKVDVRVLAATNRDLAGAVRKGLFREDLYYRLNVFPILLPPLRDRVEDIPQLVWAFVEEFSEAMGKVIETIPDERMDALRRYPWPGNVRELRNVIERAMILARDGILPVELSPPVGVGGSTSTALADVERRHILSVLERTAWRVRGSGGAAALLGLKPTTLEARMKRLGVRRPGLHSHAS